MAQYSNKYLLGLKEKMSEIYENKTFTNNEVGLLHYRLSEYPEKYSKNENFEEILECYSKYISIIVKYSEINHLQSYTLFRSNISRYMSGVAVIEQIPEFVNKFVKEITVPILEHITDPSINVICAKELIRTYNIIITSCTRTVREELANSSRIYLYKLADLVCSCGDYEYQTCLLETIFRVCPMHLIKAHASDFFPAIESLQQALIKFDVKNFDNSVRIFLRIVNSIVGNVYSFVADDVLLDKVNIIPPADSQGRNIELWIDCNKTSSTLGIYCDQTCLRTESLPKENDGMGWELITIFVDDISLVEIKKPKKTNEAQNSATLFRFTLINQFHVNFPSSEGIVTSKYLKVVIYDSKVAEHLQNSIFPFMFGEKLQGIANKKSKMSDISSLEHSYSSKGKYKPLRISVNSSVKSITSMDSRSMKSLDDLMGVRNAVNKSKNIVTGVKYVSPNSTILDVSFGNECVAETQYFSANEELDSDKNLEQEVTGKLKIYQSCLLSDYDKKPLKKEKIKVKFPFIRKQVSTRKKSFDPLFSPISESIENSQLERKDSVPKPSCSKQIDAEMEENSEVIVSTPPDINQRKTKKGKRRKEKHFQTITQKQAVENEVIVEDVQAKTLGDVKKMNQSLNDLENNLNERQQEILLGTEHNSVERCDVLSRTCEIPETTKDNLNQINPEIAVNGSNNNICKPEILEDAYEYFTALWDELDDVVKGTEQEDPATNNKTNSTSKSCKSVISVKKLIPVVIQEDIQKIGDKNSTQSNGKNFPQKYKQGLKKRATESITSNELANSQIEKIIHKNNDKNDHITDSQILECSEIVADAIERFSAEEANKKGILTSQVMETESSTTKDLSEGKLLKKKGTQKLCDEKQLNFEEENAHSEETKKVYREILNIAKIMAEKNSNLLNECSNKAEIGTETLHSTPSQKIPIIRRQEGDLLFAKRGDSQLTESNDSTFANENLVQTIRRNERKDVGAVQDLKLKVKRTNLEELRNTQEGLVTDNNINSASKNCKSLVTKLIPLDVQQDRDKDLNQDDVAGGNSRKCKRALRKRATVNEPANSQMEKSIKKTNEKDDRRTHSPPEIIAQRIEKANKGHHSQVVDMECSKTKELSEGKLLKKKETQKLYDEKQHVEVEYAESEKISDSNLPNECLNKPQTRMKELNIVPSQKNDSLSIVQQQKSDLQFERKAGNQLIESDGSTFVDENLLQALGGKKQKDVAKPVEMENAIINVNKSTIKSEHVVDLTQLPGNNGNKSAYATEANNFNDKTITKAKYTKDSDSDMSSQVISGINTFQIKQKKKIRSQMRRSQSSNKKNDTPDAAVENYKEGTNLEISEGGDAVTRAQTNASSAIVSNAVADEFIGLQNSMFDEFLANETTHLEIETVPSQKEHVRVNVSQNIGDVEKNLKIDKSPASAVDQSEECAELRKSRRKKSLFYSPDSHLHDDHKNVKKKRTERKTKNIDSVHQNTRQKTYSYIEIKENCGSKYEGVSKNIEDKVQKTEDVEANEKKRGRKKTADTQKIPSLCENNNNTVEVNSPPLALSVDDSKITKNNENKDKDVGAGEIKDIKSVKKNKSGIIGKHQKDETKFADTALENTQKEPKSKVKRKSNVNKNCNVLSVAESDNKMEEVIIKDSVYDDEVDVFLKSTLELDKSDGNTSAKLKRGTENGTKDKSEMTSPILNDDKAVKQLMQTESLIKNLLPEEIVCNDFKNDEIENIDAAAIDKDQPQENNKDKKSEKIRNTPSQNVLIHTFDVNTETVISSSQKSKRNSLKRKLSQSDTKLFLKSKRFKLYDPNDFSHLENDDFVDKDLTVIPQCKTSPNKPLKALQKTKQETSTTANKKSLREKNKIKEKRKSTTRPAQETSGTGQDTILNLLSRGAVNISTVPCSLPENLIKSEITNNSVKNTSYKAMSILNGEEETVLKEGVDKTNEQNPNSSNANQRFQLNNIARHNFSHKNYEKTLSSSSSSESDDEPPKRIEVVAMIHSAGERTNNNRNIIHETKKVECVPESVDNKKKGSKLKQTSTTSKQRSRKRKPVVQKNWSPETTKLDQSHKEIFDTFLGSFADDIDKYRVPVNKKHTHSRLQKRNRGKKAMKINILEDIVLKSANEELTNESVESDEAAESDNVPEPMDSTLEIVNDASGSESKHLEVLWREILKLLLKVKNVLIKTAPNSIRHTNEYRNLLKHLLAVKKAATKLK